MGRAEVDSDGISNLSLALRYLEPRSLSHSYELAFHWGLDSRLLTSPTRFA
jgi:hypothetical protein